MTAPFRRSGGEITLLLSRRERAVLRMVPELLDSVGDVDADPAAERLHPAAYPDDPAADADYHEMVDGDLARARAADRRRFTETVDDEKIALDDAQTWMRVVGDARLALAARMGIDDEEWEDDGSLAQSSEGAMLHYLGYIQDALIRVVSADL